MRGLFDIVTYSTCKVILKVTNQFAVDFLINVVMSLYRFRHKGVG